MMGLALLTCRDLVLNRSSLKNPAGTKLTKSAAFDSDGTDGKIYYAAVAGDLDETGTYEIQGKVIVTDGTFYTDIQTFKVHRNL